MLSKIEVTDAAGWTVLRRAKLEPSIVAMSEIVKHLHDIAAFSSLRGDLETQYVTQRKAGLVQMTEHSQFPMRCTPLQSLPEILGTR